MHDLILYIEFSHSNIYKPPLLHAEREACRYVRIHVCVCEQAEARSHCWMPSLVNVPLDFLGQSLSHWTQISPVWQDQQVPKCSPASASTAGIAGMHIYNQLLWGYEWVLGSWPQVLMLAGHTGYYWLRYLPSQQYLGKAPGQLVTYHAYPVSNVLETVVTEILNCYSMGTFWGALVLWLPHSDFHRNFLLQPVPAKEQFL